MPKWIEKFRITAVRNTARITKSHPILYSILKTIYHYLLKANNILCNLKADRPQNKKIESFLAGLSENNKLVRNSQDYNEHSPLVSIVILNWNKSDLTLNCIREVHKHTQGVQFEIIVVDNGSNPQDFENLTRSNLKFQIIRLNTNRFYGEGNNIGVEHAKGSLIFFLNNDAFVTSNCIQMLVETLQGDESFGAVGPKMIYPDGTLQEAGAMITNDGQPQQLGKYDSPNNPKFDCSYEVDYVSAAALLIHKKHFELVNGFDMQWEPAYFEDVDLCLKVKSIGKKIWYDNKCTVIHIENFSTKDSNNRINFNRLIITNQEKFITKWAPYFKSKDASFMSVPQKLPPHTPQDLPIAGVYTPYNLNPGGGERFLLSFISAMAKKYQIVLFFDEIYSEYRIRSMFKELNIPGSFIKIEKKENAPKYNMELFLCMGNEILPPLPAIGSKKNMYICQFPFPLTPPDFANRWGFLDDYDSIIAYSKYTYHHIESKLIQNNLPKKKITIVYPPCGSRNVLGSGLKNRPTEVINFISVGRFFRGGHCKNHHETVALFQMLQKQNPEIKMQLHIAGTVSPDQNSSSYFDEIKVLSSGAPIKLYPNIAVDELHHLYATSHFYIHAAGFREDESKHPERMEHFGITVVEAMQHGLVPIVYSVGGPAEIVRERVDGLHYTTSNDFTEQVGKLIKNPELINDLSKSATSRAKEYSDYSFQQRVLEIT